MRLFNIIFPFSLLIEITITFNNFKDFNSFSLVNEGKDDLLRQMLNLTIHLNTLIRFINVTNEKCRTNLSNHYHNNDTALNQLYEGSSKGFIDLNSFSSCINSKGGENTFYTVYPNSTERSIKDITQLDQTFLDEHFWIFGICLKKDICDYDDIKSIFDSANNLFQKPFKLYTKNNITVFDYYKEQENIITSKNIARQFVPLLFLLVQIILMIFKIIPAKIFGFFIRRRYIREAKNTKATEEALLNNNFLNNQISLKIKQCFSVSEIMEDLINTKKNEIFKDNDMTYLKGIKSLGIIFFIFGFNFIILYNYPLCLSAAGIRKNFMEDNRTLFLIICFRLAPALILSTSGYSLSYKFLNFLDNKLTNIGFELSEQNKNNEKDKNEVNKVNELDKNKIENDNNIDKIAEKIEKDKKEKDISENNSS